VNSMLLHNFFLFGCSNSQTRPAENTWTCVCTRDRVSKCTTVLSCVLLQCLGVLCVKRVPAACGGAAAAVPAARAHGAVPVPKEGAWVGCRVSVLLGYRAYGRGCALNVSLYLLRCLLADACFTPAAGLQPGSFFTHVPVPVKAAAL
jgi:hypothetical protein